MDNETSAATAWLESAGGAPSPIRGTCSVGRSATNHVVLPDDKVSRRHAMIHAQGQGEFWLVDLGSSNGTYLNGRRVAQPCRLNDQDRIDIAGHSITFRQAHHGRATEHTRTTEKTIQDIRSLECWLLVADLEDSTHFLNQLPADQVPRFTGRWLAACKQIVDDQNGTINKFLGDGFFAYWPARDNTAASVAHAFKSLRDLQKLDGPRFRLALHFGKVFVGGEASLGEESLLGAEVNFVFRMEKLAGTLGARCLLSDRANTEIKSLLPTTGHGRHALQSFAGDFPFFTV